MKSVVEIFVKLGERLRLGPPREMVEAIYRENQWFTECEVMRALEAIRTTMLSREAMERWLTHYPNLPKERAERVLIIMAGNIPLVGFFDLLCVICSGDRAIVKYSHKDRILMEWVVALLRDIDNDIPIFIYDDSTSVDRVIATGGDSAVDYFKSRYGTCPTLLRGSRHSVAVIAENTQGLERDLYYYSGLGCRNISMIFAPRGYDLSKIATATDLNEKYINNLRQSRALLRMRGVEFFDNGSTCFVRQSSFSQRISVVSVVEYDRIEEVERWLAEHDDELQCVVADEENIHHPRRCNFGEAQYPTLFDYADGVDTMNFLS